MITMRDYKRTKELALKSYKFELSTRYNNINANPTKKFAYLAHISILACTNARRRDCRR